MSDQPFTLRGEGLRNWLRTAGQGFFTDFESGAAGLDAFREAGYSIRTQDFYAIRRQVLGLQVYQEQLSTLNYDSLIPAAWTSDTHGLTLSSDFLYRVRLTGFVPGTDVPVERFVSVASNNQLSAGDVLEQAQSMIQGEESFYGVESYLADIVQALARPGTFNR